MLPYLEVYFIITEKRLMEAINGTKEVGTWVYLSDWPRVRSADGSTLQNWGVNPRPYPALKAETEGQDAAYGVRGDRRVMSVKICDIPGAERLPLYDLATWAAEAVRFGKAG